MALAERFGAFQGTTLGVQMRAISGIATLAVDGVQMLQAMADEPTRAAFVTISVDGDQFELDCAFTDETLDKKTFLGHDKKREAN